MTRTSLESFNCSWARAIDQIADKWKLMIIRDLFSGDKTFSHFKRNHGVARNILTTRLVEMAEDGIIDRVQTKPGIDRHHYSLSEKGRALFPLYIAMGQWGDEWIFGEGQVPITVTDKKQNAELKKLTVMSKANKPLEPEDINYAPGPGADEITKRVFTRKPRKEA